MLFSYAFAFLNLPVYDASKLSHFFCIPLVWNTVVLKQCVNILECLVNSLFNTRNLQKQ